MNLIKLSLKKNSRKLILKIKKDELKVEKKINKADELIEELDKFLKKNKIKIELFKDINVETDKEIGLTSYRIVKAIEKALNFQN
ncbi:MAG: hypothetical protein GF387_02485 [Candidatus Portnoybacteria bacterium]|nr:hypothetical protein [Candidatus Portnoybacteria bacterium]